MHNHIADGMLQFDQKGLTPRALRLHLDNSHDARTTGWDLAALDGLHHKLHDGLHHKLHNHEAVRLGEIEDAANLLAERLAAAAPALVESIVGDRSFYLSDGNGGLYLAERVGAFDWPDDGRPDEVAPLYRLTAQVDDADLPPAPVDLMDQLRESLAAANRTLSAKPPQREASGGGSAVDAPAAVPTDRCGPCSLDVHDDCHRHVGDECGCADTPTCGAAMRVFSAGGES